MPAGLVAAGRSGSWGPVEVEQPVSTPRASVATSIRGERARPDALRSPTLWLMLPGFVRGAVQRGRVPEVDLVLPSIGADLALGGVVMRHLVGPPRIACRTPCPVNSVPTRPGCRGRTRPRSQSRTTLAAAAQVDPIEVGASSRNAAQRGLDASAHRAAQISVCANSGVVSRPTGCPGRSWVIRAPRSVVDRIGYSRSSPWARAPSQSCRLGLSRPHAASLTARLAARASGCARGVSP